MPATIYSNSERLMTTGVAVTAITPGAPAKGLLHVSYEVQLDNTGVVATLYLVVRWKDREGVTRSHAAAAVGLLGTPSARAVVPIWVEDSGEQGADIEYEITTLGLLGANTYHYWIAVEHVADGV